MKTLKKAVLLILIRLLLMQPSSPAEKYVIFWENKETGEVHKCRRENYNELKELTTLIENKQHFREYEKWEYKQKFNNRRK